MHVGLIVLSECFIQVTVVVFMPFQVIMGRDILDGRLLHLLEGAHEQSLQHLAFLLGILVIMWPEIDKSEACVTSLELRLLIFEELQQLLLLILKIVESANLVCPSKTLLLLSGNLYHISRKSDQLSSKWDQ